ncbi:hyoscyamine 6-dioxygenase-like [Henckelia pumila]|uniref:hyoscyamine 6-dioxygenase-like n=1 Tax=Henckelia pumila TaxID=405737 RepID=UPI003C6DC519
MDTKNDSSKWFNVQLVPHSHIFSRNDRPGKEPIPLCKTIPVVDINTGERNYRPSKRANTIQAIIRAGQEFGFFQVVNHGVPEEAVFEAEEVTKELFSMGVDEISADSDATGWVYMGSCSTNYATKDAHLWRENIKHPCHPLEECLQYWPRKPARYRDVISAYIAEIKKLSLKILGLISEGLGLEEGYLEGMSQVQFLTASNYPPCPNPSLTLGLLKHFDHSLITILFQGDVEGLQVMKDGKWIGIETVPHAFVVNIGTQLEIISNGKLRSAEHRVVTNPYKARTSIATFINPCPNSIIQPAQILLNKSNPPLYQPLLFKKFVTLSKPFGPFTDALTSDITP